MNTENTLKKLAVRLGREYDTLCKQALRLGIEPAKIGGTYLLTDEQAERLKNYERQRPGPKPKISTQTESDFDLLVRGGKE